MAETGLNRGGGGDATPNRRYRDVAVGPDVVDKAAAVAVGVGVASGSDHVASSSVSCQTSPSTPSSSVIVVTAPVSVTDIGTSSDTTGATSSDTTSATSIASTIDTASKSNIIEVETVSAITSVTANATAIATTASKSELIEVKSQNLSVNKPHHVDNKDISVKTSTNRHRRAMRQSKTAIDDAGKSLPTIYEGNEPVENLEKKTILGVADNHTSRSNDNVIDYSIHEPRIRFTNKYNLYFIILI